MFKKICVFVFVGLAAVCPAWSAEQPWWWDSAWWDKGILEAAPNHAVVERELSYASGDVDVPVRLYRPAGDGKYPAVLYLHGRRGLDDVTRGHARRLAARGLVVFAPDLQEGRFIPAMPIEHDYALEGDAEAGLDKLLSLPDVAGKRACVYGISRGGYVALKLAVARKRQESSIACYVGYYPHMQDPNAPEPMQVYRYAAEAEDLRIPTLIFIGDQEQYQRRRGIEMAVEQLERLKRPVRLVIYPGVGRGFDFREVHVRTFADDLATKDALVRATTFMRQALSKAD